MIRNSLRVILLSLTLLVAAFADAQLAIGDWRFYTAFQGGGISQIAVTPSKVYFLSGINLYSYDPATQESVSYSKENLLNGVKVESIHYNPDKDYLLVCYPDANMDIIYRDGSVANYSAIRDASISGEREIRSVCFRGDNLYAGTDFGLVVINTSSRKVVESGRYNMTSSGSGIKLPSGGPSEMAVVGDRLVAIFDGELYESFPDDRTHTYREAEKFTHLGKLTATQLIAWDDATMICIEPNGSSNKLSSVVFPVTPAGSAAVTTTRIDSGLKTGVWRDGDKLFTVGTSGKMFEVTPSKLTNAVMLPDEIKKFITIGSSGEGKRTWMSLPEGLICYDVTAEPPSMVYPFHTPVANSVYNVSWFNISPDKKRIYVSTRSSSHSLLSASGQAAEPLQKEIGSKSFHGFWTPGFIDMIEDQQVRPVRYVKEYNNAYDGKGFYETEQVEWRYGKVISGIMSVAENPRKPEQIWVASINEGLYRIEGGRTDALFAGKLNPDVVGKGKYDNIPIAGAARQLVHDVAFDRDGNLWVLAANNDDKHEKDDRTGNQLVMLPAHMVDAPFGQITKDKWISRRGNTPLIPDNVEMSFDGRILMMEHNDIIAIMPNRYNGKLLLYRHKGTLGDVSDDECIVVDDVIDQDGNKITAGGNVASICEDPSGNLLVGNGDAFFMIKDPEKFDPSTDRVHRFKISRDDGSGTADYMFSDVIISGMSSDAAGRLWVATEGSGLSVVKADYSDIEEQFTTENSPLPTNYLSAVIVDPTSNRVFVGTKYGLGEYASDQSPVSEDYDSVRAYPNPVRPGYKGVITIDGLMDNSLVKITDAMGNMVWSGISTGGMITWNGRDLNDARLKSGVYYVMVSQREDGGSKGKIGCKILFMR